MKSIRRTVRISVSTALVAFIFGAGFYVEAGHAELRLDGSTGALTKIAEGPLFQEPGQPPAPESLTHDHAVYLVPVTQPTPEILSSLAAVPVLYQEVGSWGWESTSCPFPTSNLLKAFGTISLALYSTRKLFVWCQRRQRRALVARGVVARRRVIR